MPDAELIALADAVVTAANAASFSQTFTAARTYAPQFELQEMGTLHVTVVPTADAVKRISRATKEWDFELQVGVMKKPATLTDAALDELMYLIRELIVWALELSVTVNGNSARCMTVENVPAYSQEHLHEFRQFTSILTLGFKWRG